MKIEDLKTVKDIDGNIYHINKMIGHGGQGAVYRLDEANLAIKVLTNGEDIIEDEKVFKIFEDKTTDIMVLKDDKRLNLCKPLKLLQPPLCGYIMKLLSDLVPADTLLFSQNDDTTLDYFMKATFGIKKRYEILTELARNLAQLHSQGLVYCDISPNNVFFANNDHYSKVWLIDCDNLKFNNARGNTVYTPGYGAPEVVNNVSSNTIFSDCYSFAVLAFKLLTNRDPFQEAENNDETTADDWDASTTVAATSSTTVKVFNPDEWNEDLKEYYTHFITKTVLELFKKTFSKEAQLMPTLRPSMRTWFETLKDVLMTISKCPHCGTYIFTGEHECPFCKQEFIKKDFGIINVALPHYKEDAEDVIKSLDDEVIPLDEKTKDRLRKSSFEKKYVFNIYDGLIIYDTPFKMMPIEATPREMLIFEKSDVGYYIYNVSNVEFAIKNDTFVDKIYPGSKVFISDEKTTIMYLSEESKLLYLIGVRLNVR